LHRLSQNVALESDFHATSSVTSADEVIRPRTGTGDDTDNLCPELV
jgi:hypothetical protein